MQYKQTKFVTNCFLLAQVWFYFLISVLVFIAIMCLFSLALNREVHNPENKRAKLNSQMKNNAISKLERFINTVSYYVIYEVNILTNHGKFKMWY